MEYVISDLHFGDESVLYKRNLNVDIDTYNKLIVDRINAMLSKNDTLYVLGDVGINDKRYLKNIIKNILCKKILIKGNHDLLKDSDYIEIGFIKVYDSPIFYKNNIILSHYPLPVNNDYYLNIHGHLHGEKLSLKNYFNVNVDVNSFKPVKLEVITRLSNNLKKVEKKFGNEWYFDESSKGQIINKLAIGRI